MGRARWLWLLAPLLLAAWPDIYPSRRIAVSALRYNLISPELQYDAAEIEERYKRACRMGFGLACSWQSWQSSGHGDLSIAADFMKKRCSWEPLACVVRAWALSRVDGTISPASSAPEEAAALLVKSCKEELFAPACTSLGELYLEGVGVPQDVTEAHAFITEGCEADDWWGCYQLGRLYQRGIGVDADAARAAELFTAACDNAVPQSCTALADAMLLGTGVDKDVTRAAELYAGSCSDRHTRSCATLATLYERGVGVEASPYAAIGLYQTACRAGDHGSCYELAGLYAEGRGIEVDADKALGLLDETCAVGDPRSCSALGGLYLAGQIVDRDLSAGLELLGRGCTGGDQEGCVSLGHLYERGDGVDKDIRLATAMFDQACRADAGAGCTALGRMEAEGIGTEPDLTEAQRLYGKGCQLGDGEGCGSLARYHRLGQGVEKDLRAAVALLGRGCELGDGQSCGELGEATARGSYGLKKDPAQAEALYRRACRLGDGIGCMGVAESLTEPAELLAAFESACAAGIEAGCEAAEPMQLDARYAELVTASLTGSCEVWGIDSEDVSRTRQLASLSGAQLILLAGPHAGQTILIEPGEAALSRRRKAITGVSRFGMRLVWQELELKIAVEENIDPKAALSEFPPAYSYSDDPTGKSTLIFSREDGSVRRDGIDRCSISEGYRDLNAEGCSMTQALIAAQLLSECR
ncbi:MAG: TPR repeat protein [Myxococcota bacterium]|jgi:TPR repeat protein